MKILYITLEFTNSFSGNGRFSQSLVRSLLAHHHVFVICCCPKGLDDQMSEWREQFSNGGHSKKFIGMTTAVEKWKSTAREGPWAEFCQLPLEICEQAKKFQPDVVLGIDWTARAPYEFLLRHGFSAEIPFVYYNFRVYYHQTNNTAEDVKFYREQELATCRLSKTQCVLCLSRTDQQLLNELAGVSPIVIYPGLRLDVENSVRKAPNSRVRKYFLSCVRLDRDKNVEAYAEVVTRIAPILQEVGLVPLIVGAIGDKSYAERICSEVQNACPTTVIRQHMNTEELCEILSETLINLHPALYEAYGMTIMEAAAFGVPSVINRGGTIGVSGVLVESDDMSVRECIALDLTNYEEVCRELTRLLRDDAGRKELHDIGQRAKKRSLNYTENHCGEHLAAVLQQQLCQQSAN